MLLGVIEVLGLMLLRSKLFLLSPAPNPSNARGGDPNAMLLGGHKSPWGYLLLRSKLFLLSPVPNPSNFRGGDPNDILGVFIFLNSFFSPAPINPSNARGRFHLGTGTSTLY